MTDSDFIAVLSTIFPDKQFPRPFHLLQAASAIDAGSSVKEAAHEARTTRAMLERVRGSGSRVATVLRLADLQTNQTELKRITLILGQMTLGGIAERVFEELYKEEMATEAFALQDVRETRTDTDYRVLNGQRRRVFRLNIKFHGSRFRRAPELVDLPPEDCFALATYKIHSALQKQHEEGLPYIFAIVGVATLTGEAVGSALPPEYATAAALVHASKGVVRKRDFEDAIVAHLLRANLPAMGDLYAQIKAAEWYVLSARRADLLLRGKLFDRVYALRIRGFARVFRGAELDMHFSLSKDLNTLHSFLSVLKSEGMQKVVTLLERGVF